MKIARVLVSPELLRQLFTFPDGTEIISAGMEHREIVLYVQHDVLQDVTLAENERPPVACPRFQRREPVEFLGWGQT